MESVIWLAVYGVELAFFSTSFLWRFKRILSGLLLVAIILSTALFFRTDYAVWFYITLPVNLFRMINVLRVLKSRMHTTYLQQASLRTSLVLGLVAAFAMAATLPIVFRYYVYLPHVQLLIAGFICFITIKNLRGLRFRMPKTYMTDTELPTVTVAIPARNETKDLEECLHEILDNDYPKLEILVLDDCSQDKTAEVIRSFAQSGVRFVQGSEPTERWLAKNQAYEKLYEEASGELVLFCGVDVRLGRQTIRNMVNLLHSRQQAMLSILPIRDRSTPSSAFIQPMRYWWELALPRHLFRRPPVLSTCWLISRKRLKQLGSFAAVSHALFPEGFFARELLKTKDYSFVRSNRDLDVRTVKSLSGQKRTAVRTLYPKIRRRPENALILTIINALFLVGPFGTLAASFWLDNVSLWVSAAACLLLVTAHVAIVASTDSANVLVALVTYPIAIGVETVIGYVSMLQYEFFTIEWKDRNICIPVMHVVPRLPESK